MTVSCTHLSAVVARPDIIERFDSISPDDTCGHYLPAVATTCPL